MRTENPAVIRFKTSINESVCFFATNFVPLSVGIWDVERVVISEFTKLFRASSSELDKISKIF